MKTRASSSTSDQTKIYSRKTSNRISQSLQKYGFKDKQIAGLADGSKIGLDIVGSVDVKY